MPELAFNWTLSAGDVLLSAIALIGLPILRGLAKTLWAMRETVTEISAIVMGTTGNPDSGLVRLMAEHAREIKRHRDWLIRISAEAGTRIEDRS